MAAASADDAQEIGGGTCSPRLTESRLYTRGRWRLRAAVTMNVLFAPDWRDGVPYQRLLAGPLEEHGVRVSFLRDYKRGLPLARLVRERARQAPVDILHLHWPEAYYP